MTAGEAVRQAASLLESAFCDSPGWQARVLAAHVLQEETGRYLLFQDRPLSARQKEQYFSLLHRLLEGFPLQHVTGSWDFRGRTFRVTPAALIPRPETEQLIDLVLSFCLPVRPLILDAGTGSGVIGITLSLDIPGSTVIGTDISRPAIDLAAENAALLGASSFLPVQADLSASIGCGFHAIAANLPYVPTADIQHLPEVVRNHDPHTALDGGKRGTSLILGLVQDAFRLLAPGGLMALETGSDQRESVPEFFAPELWKEVRTHDDLTGRHRFVTALRK